jgi:hypothetical protein
MASADELAQIDQAVREVRSNYVPARALAAGIRAQAASLSLGRFLVTDAQLSVAKNIEDLGPQIDRWATTYRADAVAGKNAHGTRYTVAQFLDAAKVYGSAIRTFRGGLWEGSLFAVVANTTTATARTVATAVNPLAWPTEVKVAAAVVAVVVVLAVARPYVAPILRGAA